MGLRDTILTKMGLAPASRVLALQERMGRLQQKLVASGVDQVMGKFKYEANTELQGTKKWTNLDKMENDPHITGALRVNTLPLLQAEWEITPASDDERDVEVAEFVSANLLRKSTDRFGREYWVQTSWRQRLAEQLDMLRSGFSMFALTTRSVGGKVVFDQIKWLEPSSVDPYGWKMDEVDRLTEVLRTYQSPTGYYKAQEPINADSLALYVWDLKGARLEGRPMVRSMYGAWYRKEFVQRMAAIWAQKVGAPPPVAFYPENYTEDEIEAVQQVTESLRGEAPGEAFGVFPKRGDERPEFTYAGSETNVERGMTTLIQSENAEIAHAGGSKSDLLGETASGSRALGDTQQAREVQMVEAVASTICEYEAHGVNNLPGLIERLVDWNYQGVQAYPSLTCSGVAVEDEPTTDEIVKAWTAKIIPHHPDARRQLAQRYGIELPDEAYEIQEPPALPPGAASVPGQEIEESDETEDTEAVAAAAKDDFKQRIAAYLIPIKEGQPPNGGRFPDETGGEAS